METTENTQNLRAFIQYHRLMDSHSNVRFRAHVSIETTFSEKINQEMIITVSLNGYNEYGTVKIVEPDLDGTVYPIEYKANFQTMKHIGNSYLQIKGNHRINPRIGAYTTEIHPIGKV